MFTAVTTFISTMQHYMLASVLSTQGSWHAQLAGLPYDAAGQLRDDPKIKAVAVQQEIGYARLPESQNDYKPYWYIQAFGRRLRLPCWVSGLVEGRMPQNAGELLVPEHVLTSGGVAVKAGGYLTLSVGGPAGRRRFPLTQTNPYNEEEPETIRIRGDQSLHGGGDLFPPLSGTLFSPPASPPFPPWIPPPSPRTAR